MILSLTSCASEPRGPFGEDCRLVTDTVANSLWHIQKFEDAYNQNQVLDALSSNQAQIQNLLRTKTYTKNEAETLANIVIFHQTLYQLINEKYPAVSAWQIKGMSNLAAVQTQNTTLCLKTLD